MDNAAFRSLVSKPSHNGETTNGFKKPTSLGSRARSSIPMTPRHVAGYNNNREFARQVAEQTASANGEPPLKRFKSSAAPKGTKLGSRYVDRAQLRKGQDGNQGTDGDTDDRATRLQNLEEQLKLGQIEQAQFENLRDQIGIGGDVSSTHLVKGLDWKLLERVRRGEDVTKAADRNSTGEHAEEVPDVDVDEQLERALERDVVARQRDVQDTSAEMLDSQLPVLTRDEILRRYREQRDARAIPTAPVLNDRFKKVASSEKPSKRKFVESINGRRREVLVITNKDGTTKRKTRWLDAEDATKPEQQPLGMKVPAELAAKHRAMLEAEAAADENDDIFADVGDDYNPLAGIDSGDDESDKVVADEVKPQSDLSPNRKKRNYFATDNDADEGDRENAMPATNDPTLLAALKRAAEIRKREEAAEASPNGPSSEKPEIEAGAKSSAFLAKLKERDRQDAADLDYGFGESRFGDDDDEDAGALYDDEDGEKKKSGRKRGPKKRKGDKDNAQDVMRVLEGRNKGK